MLPIVGDKNHAAGGHVLISVLDNNNVLRYEIDGLATKILADGSRKILPFAVGGDNTFLYGYVFTEPTYYNQSRVGFDSRVLGSDGIFSHSDVMGFIDSVRMLNRNINSKNLHYYFGANYPGENYWNSNNYITTVLSLMGVEPGRWFDGIWTTPGLGKSILTNSQIEALLEDLDHIGIDGFSLDDVYKLRSDYIAIPDELNLHECFPADALILMADGSQRRIVTIRPGDMVLAFDPDLGPSGPLIPRRVLRVFEGVADRWQDVNWLEEGERRSLYVTPGHRFFQPNGTFSSIGRVVEEAGFIVLASGAVAPVTSDSEVMGQQYGVPAGKHDPEGAPDIAERWKKFNIEVDELHTYIANGVRVHNDSLSVGSVADVVRSNSRMLSTVGLERANDISSNPFDAFKFSYDGADRMLFNVGGNSELPGQAPLSWRSELVRQLYTNDGTSIWAVAYRLSDGSVVVRDAATGYRVDASKITGVDNLPVVEVRSSHYKDASLPGQPDVVLGSGSVASPGQKWTSADGRYTYLVLPDGRVKNLTTGHISSSSGSGSGQQIGGYNTDTGWDDNSRTRWPSGTSSGSLLDPVVLDLDGDGLQFDALLSSNVFVDVVGDGRQHRTAWAGVGDGVLVRDDGNDGTINQYREVVFTEWDPTARTDFEALRNAFDTNHDGQLTSADTDWALFKVLVTRSDGSTELRTLADLGITSIGLISNGHEVVLPDGSRVNGTATYTRSDGSTGLAGDVSLAYDSNGYIVSEVRSTDSSGNTTLVHRASRADGTVASETTTITSADGLSRSISFDVDGDGVLDRIQTDVTVFNVDGSRTVTTSVFDGSGTILASREVTDTSSDGLSVSVSRDTDGSGAADQLETRVTDGSGSLTLTLTQLNADGSPRSEVVTVTSADGLSKTRQFDFTGGGTVNSTESTVAVVDGAGTRSETKTTYAGSGTATTNRTGSITTATSSDGASKTVAVDLDGDGTIDITSVSSIVRNPNGSTTTTISDYNGNGGFRDRSVTELSSNGRDKTVRTDANGDGVFELTGNEVTTLGTDGAITKTSTQRAASGVLLSIQEQSWSANGQVRSTRIDRDGDGNVDQTETVAVVSGNSVATTTSYSANGAVKLLQTVSTTSSDGLSQSVSRDLNGDGASDTVTTSVTTIGVGGASTVTISTWNGDQSILIGKVIETTSADGLSISRESHLGTASLPNASSTDVTVQNLDGSLTRTVTTYAGTSAVQVGRTVTEVSADRLTTVESSYLGGSSLPERVVTSAQSSAGVVSVNTSHYTPDGSGLTQESTSVVSADGLSSTTTVDLDGDGTVDGTVTVIKTLNSDGTTTTTESHFAGSSSAPANLTAQAITEVSANGLATTVYSDLDGDGTTDRRTASATVLNADGSRTQTVVSSNGAGTLQLGKTVTTISDDGWTTTVDTFLGTHSSYDSRTVTLTAVSTAGVQTVTESKYAANGGSAGKTTLTKSANGLVNTVAVDLDGNGASDLVTTTTESVLGVTTIESFSYAPNGVTRSHSTTTVSADGLSTSTVDDLDNNGTADRSWTAVTVLNADGSVSKTEAWFGIGSALQDRMTKTTSADGLSIASAWDAFGTGSNSGSATDVTLINADGSQTRTVSRFNANLSLHDRQIISTAADGRSATRSVDIDGDGAADQTFVQSQGSDGTTASSGMDGTVLSASGRLYGSSGGRYETLSADGLTTTVRYDESGDGLAETQSVSSTTLASDGSRTVTLVNAALSGGVVSSANPTYSETVVSRSSITTSADGLTTSSEYDLTGSGSYQESKTDVTVLNANGSTTETISNFVGVTLKSQYQQTVSGDGLVVTKQWDPTGSGSFSQGSTSTSSLASNGSAVVSTVNTGALGAAISKFISTTLVGGMTIITDKDLDGNNSYEERQIVTNETRADGSRVQTVANYINLGTLRDYTVTDVSSDGRIVTVRRDDDQNGIAEQIETTFHRIDGSTVVTTTDYNSIGAVTGTLVSTASFDGLLITSTQDKDGDGVVDRTTSRVIAQGADGSTTSSLQTYRTSEKLANGSVVGTLPILAHSVTTAVSADGKTTIVSVDVDGDGSIDEISTSVTRVDGSVVTTVSDNSTARDFNLSTGDARWSSAIAASGKTVAASTISTLSRDGLSRTVVSDYDNNGTYEHEESWTTRIDGVLVGVIVDKDASGTVVQSGTETVSIDGRTVTLLTDFNNNGVIDRREVSYTATSGAKTKTTTDYNASGVAVQTIITTVSANGDLVTIKGSSATETLQGTSADETFIGGAGADKLIGGGGTDTASYASAGAGVVVNLINVSLNTGDAAGDTYDSIENIVGSNYNDTITARSTGFRVEYFKLSSPVTSVNSVNWSATPSYVVTEGAASWDKGTGAIYSGGPSDNVAIRMTGTFSVTTAGSYTFYDTSDDGSRVYIDGVEVINNDGVHTVATVQSTVTLAAGSHQIEVKYFEGTGFAALKLDWSGAGFARRPLEASSSPTSPVGGILAEYFSVGSGVQSLNNIAWTSTPIHTEMWAAAQKNFGSGAIFDQGPSDRVAIRLKTSVSITTAGTYTFYATSDDGAQIYVDGVRIVNNDGSHAVSTVSGTVSLTTGTHAIEVRYYDDVSVAELTVEWSGPGVSKRVLSSTNGSYAPASSPASVIWGGGGNDTITGNAGGDTLWGQAGNDTLVGGDGDDRLIGGAGADSHSGGNGIDIASYEDATSGVTVNLGSLSSNTGDAVGDTFTSIEIIIGSGFADTLIAASATSATFDGGAGNDTLTGSSASDYLYGGAGNDTLNGGGGADLLAGQGGDDTYVVDNASDVVVEDEGQGTDLVQSSITYTLGVNVENLTLTGSSAINGTGNALDNIITGNSGNNTLTGGDGNDTLNGNGGTDTMLGGNGNDIYYVDGSTDVVTELTGAGIDEVRSTVTYTLGNYLENLTLLGSSAINGTGNGLDNIIVGNSASNTLTGNGGNDTLDGGGGNDTLVGGSGDDIYIVDASGDVVTEASGQGVDTVRSTAAAYTLSANVENLILMGAASINGTGNSANNVITGNGAANVLDGGAGSDTLIGGDGNDTYIIDSIGDIVVETVTGGVDTIQVSFAFSLTSVSNVENLTLTGSGNINGTGNGGANTLIGNVGNNTLDGGAGDDTLIGGGGTDTLIGGLGDDVFVIGASGTTIVEYVGEGKDTVSSSITYTLGNNLEVLILTGASAINGTGNDLDNTITGNAAANTLTGGIGNDILDGGAGIDAMIGGVGDDTYFVDSLSDVVTELSAEGNDTVWSNVSGYVLANNVETLRLASGAASGYGNSADNTLVGNDQANTLDGGAGDDVLIGGAHNDVYFVDSAQDVVIEFANEGNDAVYSSAASYTLSDHVETLILLGATNIDGAGGSTNNTLVGNSGNNLLEGNGGDDTLQGNGGADTLSGGGGADLLYGGAGNDVFLFAATSESTATSRDQIMDFAAGDLISVSGVDADESVTGDQAFVLDTDASFSVGEIRQTVVGGNLLLEFNTDGDIDAEMSILVVGRTSLLTSTDFAL